MIWRARPDATFPSDFRDMSYTHEPRVIPQSLTSLDRKTMMRRDLRVRLIAINVARPDVLPHCAGFLGRSLYLQTRFRIFLPNCPLSSGVVDAAR